MMSETAGQIGLGSLALIAAWCHGPASPLLPAAFEPVLMAYGRLYPPLAVAVIATAASVAVETLNYIAYGYLLRTQRLAGARRASSRLTALFARRPFLACLLVASTPLPDWTARVLGAFAHYPARRYIAAIAVGRMPKFWLLATVGQALDFGRPALLAVAAGTVLLTCASLARRWFRPPRSGHADDAGLG
jgi:membrane protein YqaA with SNARE-associated domain